MNEIKENFSSSPMLSKIGKHISQRITGINKKRLKKFQCQSENVSSSPRQTSPLKITYANTVQRIKRMRNHQFKPCVGHYQVKYSVIDKNQQKINFKKLIPHFARDKPSSNFTQTQYNDPPKLVSPRVKGMQQFDRMTSREDIKGSIRKVGANPHQKRFELSQRSYWQNNNPKTISFQKMMKRKCDIFKPRQFSPDYDVNCQFGKKRLALSIIPFQKQSSRDEFFMINDNVSQLKDPRQTPFEVIRTIQFEKVLPRYRQSYLPSYLDTGINTRTSLNEYSWKTLKMNCSQSKFMNATVYT